MIPSIEERSPTDKNHSYNDAQEILEKGIGVAIVLCVAMVLLGAIVVQLSEHLPQSLKGVKKLGEIGDFLGGVLNPVVALMALFALFRSIEIQRTELKETRAVLDTQSQIQDRDRAERTFFELLSLRANAVASIEWTTPTGETTRGRAALKVILREVENLGTCYAGYDLQQEFNHWKVPEKLAIEARPYIAVFAYRYTGLPQSPALQTHLSINPRWATYEPELGHVFRATYQILKYIHKQPHFSLQEKEDLANYLRAQMSEDDFLLFGLTALTGIGRRSRAAAIVLNFYQNRLQSTSWAKHMLPLFAKENPENLAFAASEGFSTGST